MEFRQNLQIPHPHLCSADDLARDHPAGGHLAPSIPSADRPLSGSLARCRSPGEGPLTELTAATQPWWRLPLFMPRSGRSPLPARRSQEGGERRS